MSDNPFAKPTYYSGSRPQLILRDLLERFEEVITEPDGWVVTCPAHQDSSPSLRLALNDTQDLLVYCRAGCTTEDVIQELDIAQSQLFHVDVTGIDDMPALGTTTVAVGDTELQALATYLGRTAEALVDSEDVQDYLFHRFGMTLDLAAQLGLGADPGHLVVPGLPLSRLSYHNDTRLVVPFMDFDGTPRGMQGRALTPGIEPRWCGPNNPSSGGTWSKYGYFTSGSGLPEVIVTEGPGDALTAVAAGYDAVLIRGAGLASNTDLADAIAEGLTGRRVIVAGDNDQAGRKFTNTACSALSERGLSTFKLEMPAGINDIADWRADNPTKFLERLQAAIDAAPHYGTQEVELFYLKADISKLFTDTENARSLRAFILKKGYDIKYDSARGFIYYRGDSHGTWTVDAKGSPWTRNMAQEVLPYLQDQIHHRIRDIENRTLSLTDSETKKSLLESCGKLRGKVVSQLAAYAQSTRGIDAMLTELKALAPVQASFADDFDAHPDLLACANGVVDLQTGTLTPYSEETKLQYHIRRVDIKYNPDARNPRWERFIDEVCYQPPRGAGEDGHILRGMPDYLQRLMGYAITGHTSESIIAVFKGEGANGKAQALTTSVLTTRGFTTFGELKVGDQIYSPTGHPTTIIGMKPIITPDVAYRVTSRSGQSLVVHADHLWTVWNRKRKIWETLETKELLSRGLVTRHRKLPRESVEYRFGLPPVAPIQSPDVELPVDPWLLGYWLGDGVSTTGELCVGREDRQELESQLRAMGYSPSWRTSGRGSVFTVPGLVTALREMGLRGNKHIPAKYLTAGTKQRLAILQGLLDSDGHASKSQGQVYFTVKNRNLAEGVLYLARSLGHTATLRTHRAKLNGRDCGPVHTVLFTPRVGDAPVFRYARKQANVVSTSQRHTDAIVSIEEVPGVPMRCIAVDSPDHLYLAGRDLMPTHNTVLLETVSDILEHHTVTTPFATFERTDTSGSASPAIAEMAGARIVVASEGESGRPMGEAMLKRLTGNERVSARFLYQDSFTFMPQCQIVLATNHNPQFRGRDNGIWRRIHLVPFPNRFEGVHKDKYLMQKFLERTVPANAYRPEEDYGDGREGILAWLVRGAMAWYQDGIERPRAVVAGTEDLKQATDQLADFIEEKLVYERDSKIPLKEAYLLYQEWADEEGMHGKDIWKRKTFKEAMGERGAVEYRPGGVAHFKHYRKKTARDTIPHEDEGSTLFALPTPEEN